MYVVFILRYCRSPGRDVVAGGLEGSGIADHLVQHADDVGELGPGVTVLLPTVQHELVEHQGTVHRSRQPEVLFYGIDHLHR